MLVVDDWCLLSRFGRAGRVVQEVENACWWGRWDLIVERERGMDGTLKGKSEIGNQFLQPTVKVQVGVGRYVPGSTMYRSFYPRACDGRWRVGLPVSRPEVRT